MRWLFPLLLLLLLLLFLLLFLSPPPLSPDAATVPKTASIRPKMDNWVQKMAKKLEIPPKIRGRKGERAE